MKLLYILIVLSTVTYSQNMNNWEGKIITYKKALSLLKDFNGKEIKVDSLKSDDVYVLNDNRILLVSDILEEGIIYPNKASLFRTLNSKIIDANFEEVIKYIPENILHLAKLTGLDLSVNDKKDKLKLIDELIHSQGNVDINIYIAPLTAYLGQIIANETSGAWKYTKDEKEERLYINSGDNQYYFYHYLMDMLIEGVNEQFSFEGLYESIVNPIQFKSVNDLKVNN